MFRGVVGGSRCLYFVVTERQIRTWDSYDCSYELVEFHEIIQKEGILSFRLSFSEKFDRRNPYKMEASNQKSLEKVVSQRALQMGNSFPCQICVAGFLCGVCLTSLFLAALTSLGSLQFGRLSFSTVSMGWNSSSENADMLTTTRMNCDSKPMAMETLVELQLSRERMRDERINLLDSAWRAMRSDSADELHNFLQKLGLSKSNFPRAPHLENCSLRTKLNKHFDRRTANEKFPPWTIWKGMLDMHPAASANEHIKHLRQEATSEGAYPPWVTGSDEENYPLTRRVQRDIWIHQHPLNCRDPNVKFLVADWERLPGFGVGAQIAGMSGLLAIAVHKKRVLVSNYYNRADHDGCKSSSRSSWSCYFLPETSEECREHAFKLMESEKAWREGVITTKENYTSKHIWAGSTPRVWGDPWSYLQPTTEMNGTLVASHRKMDRRWWRAQAVRYFMRFPTEYTCSLMNAARHAAFGKLAAKLVLESLSKEGPKEMTNQRRSDIDEYVWSNHKAWIPRPLLSIHVRMGDKACEMKVAEFEEYMHLADRIRRRYPHVNSIWLSTEMQEVIEKSKEYRNWNFYYTNVKRQVGNTSMANYEASLGRETSSNYPLVNFLMASEADFFIGALGSTWCSLIDGMRNTGGKVMAGYLSVNKDRFW